MYDSSGKDIFIPPVELRPDPRLAPHATQLNRTQLSMRMTTTVKVPLPLVKQTLSNQNLQ